MAVEDGAHVVLEEDPVERILIFQSIDGVGDCPRARLRGVASASRLSSFSRMR